MTMPTIDRQSLQFAEEVEKKFSFLSAHGLKCVQSEPTLVRFESRSAYVNVYHGRQSFEVGLEIGLLTPSPEETSYSMSEIIRLVEPSKADEYRDYAAHNAEAVVEGVQRLSALLRRYVSAGILDDARLFERLGKGREAWSHNYAKEVNLTQARRKLESAWHAKDYAKVVELLNPLRDALTPTELQKLDYAEKHAKRC
jgi:hypothetical protein